MSALSPGNLADEVAWTEAPAGRMSESAKPHRRRPPTAFWQAFQDRPPRSVASVPPAGPRLITGSRPHACSNRPRRPEGIDHAALRGRQLRHGLSAAPPPGLPPSPAPGPALRSVPPRLRGTLPEALRLLAPDHRNHRREVPRLRRPEAGLRPRPLPGLPIRVPGRLLLPPTLPLPQLSPEAGPRDRGARGA